MGQYIDFNYVKRHANFGGILAYYKIDLIGSGDERRCQCPFHDDQKPSMTVNLDNFRRGSFRELTICKFVTRQTVQSASLKI